MSMIDKQLKKELEKIDVPAYNIQKFEETILKARAVKLRA